MEVLKVEPEAGASLAAERERCATGLSRAEQIVFLVGDGFGEVDDREAHEGDEAVKLVGIAEAPAFGGEASYMLLEFAAVEGDDGDFAGDVAVLIEQGSAAILAVIGDADAGVVPFVEKESVKSEGTEDGLEVGEDLFACGVVEARRNMVQPSGAIWDGGAEDVGDDAVCESFGPFGVACDVVPSVGAN